MKVTRGAERPEFSATVAFVGAWSICQTGKIPAEGPSSGTRCRQGGAIPVATSAGGVLATRPGRQPGKPRMQPRKNPRRAGGHLEWPPCATGVGHDSAVGGVDGQDLSCSATGPLPDRGYRKCFPIAKTLRTSQRGRGGSLVRGPQPYRFPPDLSCPTRSVPSFP
jgi:hypothetical protein